MKNKRITDDVIRSTMILRLNNKIPVFRVTRPTLPKFTGETLIFFQVFKKKYNFMHFERRNAF